MSAPDPAERVLEFWFGRLDANGWAPRAHTQAWWTVDAKFDQTIRETFEDDWRAVSDGHCESWLASPRGRLAYTIVLDQFSRNMFRDTPGMYTHDLRAQSVVLDGLGAGMDRDLPGHPRVFFYMPLMHAEDLALQDRCVELFTQFAAELPPDRRKEAEHHLGYAEHHRDIVRRFGRFPHRNAILNRPSTDLEKAFLQQPGSSF